MIEFVWEKTMKLLLTIEWLAIGHFCIYKSAKKVNLYIIYM